MPPLKHHFLGPYMLNTTIYCGPVLRLVFTSDGVRVKVVTRVKRVLHESNNHIINEHSRKLKGIGIARIRRFAFSSDCAYDSVTYDPVISRQSQAEAEELKPITMPIPGPSKYNNLFFTSSMQLETLLTTLLFDFHYICF